MELAELMSLRPVPGAGVLLTVTGRCPLHCAHCSTASTMASGEPGADQLLRFVGSFEGGGPAVVMLTGGEPLLRPALSAELARTARAAGTRSALLTGAFFAKGARSRSVPIPPPIMRAVTAVDHFSVSIDAFHEREVPRADVFAVLRQALDAGVATSVHAVGSGPGDPYLADVTADIRRTFDDRVPVLVNTLRAVGRAASWSAARAPGPAGRAVLPCAMAAWPVVAADGLVLACCNQDTVDRRPAPAHLTVGHIARDGWAAVAERVTASPALRMIRTVGPSHLLHRYGTSGDGPQPGYCAGCRSLGDHPTVLAAADRLAGGAAGALLDAHVAHEQTAAGPVAFVRRHGADRYADLVALGGAPR
ncbi:radical SAM protein [Actinacidiphila acididurans]|uniref:Radical SAM protein n=1 Tax=Actinacidiphila acididurans TaxID=2784346 RepID=A0ABS2U0M5_9ACTN|nr:radical SAM protein [Actinacidiphila acididurans]MBM9508887.1 radical SAM protein [Actinacidiphila acididurans]